jgi:hypothetical protein
MVAARKEATSREVAYVASPAGIFLETGTWFEIQEDALRKYAGGVLARLSVGRLLGDADIWVRSPRSLGVILLPVLLIVLPPLVAALFTILVYGVWYVLSPALVNLPLLAFFRVLDAVFVQAGTYVILLSYLAMNGMLTAVWVGLAGFVLFRWGIIERIAARLLSPVIRKVYSLPLADQVLRGVVLRHAIRLKVAMPELAEMERSIRSRWAR